MMLKTDADIVQFMLRQTRLQQIRWHRDTSGGGFFTVVRDMRIHIAPYGEMSAMMSILTKEGVLYGLGGIDPHISQAPLGKLVRAVRGHGLPGPDPGDARAILREKVRKNLIALLKEAREQTEHEQTQKYWDELAQNIYVRLAGTEE